MLAEYVERWYAAGTLPSKEEFAELQLRRQGFETFLPMRKRTVRHARRLTTRKSAFFPGYIFVRLDLGMHRWRSINGTVGVRRLISAGEIPLPVPRGIVENLQSAVDETGLVRLENRGRKGDKVLLLHGPFAGTVGEWDRMQGAQRVRVLLGVMNGSVPVVVDPACLSLGQPDAS